MRDILNLFSLNKTKTIDSLIIGYTKVLLIKIEDNLYLKDFLVFNKLGKIKNLYITIFPKLDDLYSYDILLDICDYLIVFYYE